MFNSNGNKTMITMVIPTYTITDELEELALFCAMSYRDQVDEMIITEDGGKFSQKLMDISDVYVYGKKNVGFTKNVNRGWKLSSGDFTMIVNSDTNLLQGNLRELCVPNKVCSPVIVNQYIERLAGPFWVVPKEVAKERGYLREELHTYESDSEYDNRVADIFQKVSGVEIYHKMHQTVDPAGVNTDEQKALDKQAHDKLLEEGEAVYVPVS